MIVEVVTASLSHSRAIWEWRNDPVTRSMCRSKDLVSWEDHSIWYQKALANPKRIMYVGITEQLPIGVVRFDSINNLEDSFEISININPSERGKGLGLEVFNGLARSDTGRGLAAGIGIVLLAIIIDRISLAWTKKQRDALGL